MSNEVGRPRALVTGASAGIGEAFARHLARQRYDLVLLARRRDRLETLASELSTGWSIAAEVLEADLGKDAGAALAEERLRVGDIGLLVNNAGFGTRGEFAGLPLGRELEEIDVNVRAVVRLSHAALQSMVPRRRGAIINVASTAAFQAMPRNATYAASKAFVLHFSEALHEEVRQHGVTVTCLCPGPVHTEFQQVAGVEGSRVPALGWTSPDAVVEAAVSAMRDGRAITVPGVLNKIGAVGAQLAPRFLSRRVAGAIFQGRITRTGA